MITPKNNRIPKKIAFLSLCFMIIGLISCSEDLLPVAPEADPSMTAYAVISRKPDSIPVLLSDIKDLQTRDTLHTFSDTLTFIGLFEPINRSDLTFQWSFGDSSKSTLRTVRHAYSRAGRYSAIFSVTTQKGKTVRDTVNIVVNTPPTAINLLSPIHLAETGMNQFPIFHWQASDPDSGAILRYTIWLGSSALFSKPDIQISNIDTNWYTGWNPGNETGTRYWKVVVDDGLDTLSSKVDSFEIVDYSIIVGECAGIARRTGTLDHAGIDISCVLKNGTTSFFTNTTTDKNGYFSLKNLYPGTYQLTATESKRKDYKSIQREIQITIRDSLWVDTLQLQDTASPQLTISFPIEGDTLTGARTITLLGALSDGGSGLRRDSIQMYLNNQPLFPFNSATPNWEATTLPLADGHYTFQITAQDNARNKTISSPRKFLVNAKSMNLNLTQTVVSINDSLHLKATVQNALPPIRAFYFSTGSSNTGKWTDSLLTSDDSAHFSWKAGSSVATDTMRVMAIDDSGLSKVAFVRYEVKQDAPIIDYAPDDTVINFGESIHCVIKTHQQFGNLYAELCKDSGSETWIPVSIHSGTIDTLLSTDSASTLPRIRIRITDDDQNRIDTGFKVSITPRPVILKNIDSAANQLTLHFSSALDSDFAEYRIYRDLSPTVDTQSTLWTTISNKTDSTFTGPSENYEWTHYYYRIYVRDQSGLLSSGSNVVRARILNSAPDSLTITSMKNDDTLLNGFDPATQKWNTAFTWHAFDRNLATDTLTYTLYLDTLNPPATKVYSGTTPSFTLPPAQLSGNKSYYLKIVATDLSENSRTDSLRFFLPDDPYNKMISIPDGSFQMGSPNEQPIHPVNITAFRMSNTCITQKEYKRIMGMNPSDDTSSIFLPVELVNWFDAIRYCIKRSALEGKEQCYDTTGWSPAVSPYTGPKLDLSKNGYRLPSESEWEYACRGNTTTDYSWGNAPPELYAWFTSNSGYTTHPVSQKLPNPFGLYDMNGNVWQWCWDWYGNYTMGTQKDPLGPSIGNYRTLRGGSWGSGTNSLRSAYRNLDYPVSRYNDTGFRVVCR